MMHVYRCFDEAGGLLYVGRSMDVQNRLFQHERGSWWWAKVHRVDLQELGSFREMIAAEMTAIREEKPLHNWGRGRPKGTPSQISFRVSSEVKKNLMLMCIHTDTKAQDFLEGLINAAWEEWGEEMYEFSRQELKARGA